MDILEGIRTFVRVVEAGSFTAAARQINASTAQVSRLISALENRLQVRLLHRTTRHLALSESGHRYYEKVKAILADLDLADAEAQRDLARPSGTLRVHSVLGLGQSHVTDVVVKYQAAYPDVSVELTMSQRVPSLVEEGYDVSMYAATDLPDSAYVTQAFGSSQSILVASREYLRRSGTPTKISDLAGHACLQLALPNVSPEEWRFQGVEGESVFRLVSSRFQTNLPDALRLAVQSGMGIGPLATYSALEGIRRGSLVRVLPEYQLQTLNVYAIYPSKRYVDAKVRAFLEHLRSSLSPALLSDRHDLDLLTWAHLKRS